MEKHRKPIELPGKGHMEIILECVNVLDEQNDWRTLESGKVAGRASWTGHDDLRYHLTGFLGVDPLTKNMSESRQKPWMYFYMTRESSMPDFQNEKYHFTTRANQDKVWLCDENGKAILNAPHEKNIQNMNIVKDALYGRPGRADTDDSVRLFSFDYIMSSTAVNKLILRIDDGTNNSVTLDYVMDYIFQNAPLLRNDKDLIESYIMDLRTYRTTDDATPDPV